MKIDPIPLLTRTVDHLRAHPEGHIQVALAQFGLMLGVTFGSICAGVGGSLLFGIAGALLSGGDDGGGLGGLLMLLIYPMMGMVVLLVMPPLMMLYFGYQSATLDEIDGKEPVSIRRVFGLVMGSLGAFVALAGVGCGMSLLGLMLCCVGIFLTSLPFKFAHLIRHDRQVDLGEALGLGWRGFMADPGSHAVVMVVEMVLAMVLSYIPLVGPALLWPVLAVFDSLAYRELYPREGAVVGG